MQAERTGATLCPLFLTSGHCDITHHPVLSVSLAGPQSLLVCSCLISGPLSASSADLYSPACSCQDAPDSSPSALIFSDWFSVTAEIPSLIQTHPPHSLWAWRCPQTQDPCATCPGLSQESSLSWPPGSNLPAALDIYHHKSQRSLLKHTSSIILPLLDLGHPHPSDCLSFHQLLCSTPPHPPPQMCPKCARQVSTLGPAGPVPPAWNDLSSASRPLRSLSPQEASSDHPSNLPFPTVCITS